MEHQILTGTFDWNSWGVGEKPKHTQSIGSLITGLHRSKAATAPVDSRTWRISYELPLRRLLTPLDRPLTESIVLDALGQSDPTSSTRKRDLTALRALAKFAGLEMDFTEYRHKYNRKQVRSRDLPSDDEIYKFISAIDLPDLRWACGVLACFGLRPSELCELDVAEFPRVIVHPDRKTGERTVLPLPGEWAEEWNLSEIPPTNWNMNSPQLIAHNMRHHMRDRGWRWQVYDLRHCWARRCASKGVTPAVAARMMGHSVSEHTETYHQFIGQESWLNMFTEQSGQS